VSRIPRAVLSDSLRTLLSGRRVAAGVFFTYTLEPQFFEEEVVSLLTDDALSSEPKLRMVQLEELLRSQIGPLAVYYDIGGLRGEGAARLETRRIPVHFRSGVFHPKAIVLLTEPISDNARAGRTLICGILSANITKLGWWSNLECGHFEVVGENARCSFRDDLRRMLKAVRALGGEGSDHQALDIIGDFLRDNVSPIEHATSKGRLRTRLIAGTSKLPASLSAMRGAALRDTTLEVISPFFDKGNARVLRQMADELGVAGTYVFLPKNAKGEASCSPQYFQDVVSAGFKWSQIKGEAELLRLGKDKNAKARSVHAKVYRFTSASYEALVVGSHNLTSPAHNNGGNFEASFLVEPESHGRIESWLEIDSKRPSAFNTPNPLLDEASTDKAVPFQVRFSWAAPQAARIRWDGTDTSPAVSVSSAGVELFSRTGLPPARWVDLDRAETSTLEGVLKSSAILRVSLGDGGRGTVLVQEDEMLRKPSILLTLTPAEILAYWSRLTSSQRVQYLEERFGTVDPAALDTEGIATRLNPAVTSLFDTYAGIFHAFDMLREQIDEGLKAGRFRAAECLLIGNRHDSLPRLMDRVAADQDHLDGVSRYLIMLCARQLLQNVRRSNRDFARTHTADFKRLLAQTNALSTIRNALEVGPDRSAFLRWFEKRFLMAAKRRVVSASA
jgi:hypothetical protein